MQTALRLFAACLVLHVSWPAASYGQAAAAPAPVQNAEGAEAFNTEQLDALLAPIALYPDPLLAQVLMASTFPVEIVQAARWTEGPGKDLKGDALTKGLEQQQWDPSVKSLVPFPEVLAMMNGNLEWTQQLGYAVANQQSAVLDSVQRLRKQAQAHGSLQSTPQQVVRVEHEKVVIEPAQSDMVYVPSYNPTVVYGTWPYPAYPPVYMPPPVAYPVGTALATGLAFGAGIAITAGLWNWANPSWGGGYMNVNVNRYNNINAHRAAINSSHWQANRAGVRAGAIQRPPAGPVGRPVRSAGLPANAIGRSGVSVPASAVRPPARAGGAGAGLGQTAANRPGSRQQGGAGGGNLGTRTNVGQTPAGGRVSGGGQGLGNRSAQTAGDRAGAFSGMSQGRQAAQFGQRGAQSRASAQMQRGAGGGARGGGARAGGGMRGGGRR